MLAYVLRRLAQTIPVMAVVAISVFLMLRIGVNDPAAIIAGDNANDDQIAQIRTQLGLDKPLGTQLVIWLAAIARGEFGESFYFKKQVSELIFDRMAPTAALTLSTIILAVAIAIPLGVVASIRRGGVVDRSIMGFSVLGLSAPVFVIGYGLIYVFAIRLGWLPVQGFSPLSEGVGPFFRSIALPSMTLAVGYVALIARMTRASLLEAWNEDYVRTAFSKGLNVSSILRRHALPNAAIPIIATVGAGIAQLIGGVVVTETVFSIPGLGRLTVDAALARDFPTIQAIILFFSFVYVAINLLIDLSYAFFDPRIRY